MNALLMLLNVSRPISWVNTAFPFAAGYVMMGGGFDARLIVSTVFFLIPYNLLMYGINDVFDYESDIRNPRKGGVEGAITPRKYHSLIIYSSILLSVPFVTVLFLSGDWWSRLVLAVVLFFVVAYSAAGLRFKEVPFLDSITSSIHFVGPLIYAYSLTSMSTEALVAAAAFFAWGIASQALGAVQDIVPDREAGIRSIATVLGAQRTILFSSFMYFTAFILTANINGLASVVAVVGIMYIINSADALPIDDVTSSKARQSWKRFMIMNYVMGAVITICCILVLM